MEALVIVFIVCVLIWYFVSQGSKVKAEDHTSELSSMMLEFQQNIEAVDSTTKKVRMPHGPIETRGTILSKGEVAIFDVPIIMARSIKTGSQWKSGSRGARISPIRGFSFSVGGSKGKMVATSEFQQDLGWLTLTSKRIIFKGKTISFSSPLSKIENITRDDALCFIDLTNRDVPDFHAAFANTSVASLFALLYSDPDREMVLNIEVSV